MYEKKKNAIFYSLVLLAEIVSILVVFVVMLLDNVKLKDTIGQLTAELDDVEIIEEGEIVSIEDLESGSTIYVLYCDESGNPVAIIEVGVFWELIHTSIEVGDTAVYVRDRNWQDADLLAIIKKDTQGYA